MNTFTSTLIAILFAICLFPALALDKETECNICGQGNAIGLGKGVVEFVLPDGSKWKNNCEMTQLADRLKIPPKWCRKRILKYTLYKCGCTTPDGVVLADILTPTSAPTNKDGTVGGSEGGGSEGGGANIPTEQGGSKSAGDSLSGLAAVATAFVGGAVVFV